MRHRPLHAMVYPVSHHENSISDLLANELQNSTNRKYAVYSLYKYSCVFCDLSFRVEIKSFVSHTDNFSQTKL